MEAAEGRELIDRVQTMLGGDCGVNSSELVQTLRQIGNKWPYLATAAKTLAEAVMKENAPTHNGTPQKDVMYLLRILLNGRTACNKQHRRLKAYLHDQKMKFVTQGNGGGRGIGFNLLDHEVLLQQVLASGSSGDNQEDGSESGGEVLNNVASRIANTDVRKSKNEVQKQKIKKRLLLTRQMLDPKNGSWKFVIQEDFRNKFKAEGKDEKETHRRAQNIWSEFCFPLDIYRTRDGLTGTQAELMSEYLIAGDPWDTAKAKVQKLSVVLDEEGKPSKRKIDETFKEDAIKRLRNTVATDYAPKSRAR